MSDSLRDQLKAAMQKVNEERVEVLKKDEKVFGSSPELEEIRAEDEKEEIPESKSEQHIEPEPKEPVQENHQEDEEEVKALAHWPEEKKRTFQNLSKEAKEFVLERERDFNSDYTKKTQKLAEAKKTADKVQERLSPHQEYLKSLGLDPIDAAANLIAFERKLATASPKEKAKIIQDLANRYEADFGQAEEEEEPVNPKLSKLERKLEEQAAFLARINQERESQRQYEINRTISEFKNAKDSSGKPKYPHFDTVMVSMGKMMVAAEQTGEPITMAEAYESAVMLNKELRNEFINNYTKDKLREEDNKKRLSASKNASFNVKATGSSSKETPRNLSIREAIQRAMKEANAYS